MQHPAASRRGEEAQGKPSVTSIAHVVEHYSRENPAWLTHAEAAEML